MTRAEFIEQVAVYVQKYAPQFNIRVHSPIIAQFCLESGFGTSDKVYKDGEWRHNYAGLKWRNGRCAVSNDYFEEWTAEQDPDGKCRNIVDRFCKFKSLEDCVLGYFQWTNISNYKALKGLTNPELYLTTIKACGYATSLEYVKKCMEVVKSYNLTRFDNAESQKETKMKYSPNNPPYACIQKNSSCYKNTQKMKVLGVLWHSTGANNPTLKRYVQPFEGEPNYNADIVKLGKNIYKNDWNHVALSAGLNAWIGKFADGSVGTVQTMPWDYKPWGCGAGKKGSCNSGWIQFEICEDGLNDVNYFNSVYKEACELTAYLCQLYGLDPKGNVSVNGVQVPVLTCHNDAYKLGLGNGHADINHWFPKYGKSMATVREDVAAILKGGNVASVTSSGVATISKPQSAPKPTAPIAQGNYVSDCIDYSWVFDANFYYNKYPDLQKAFGLNAESLFKHFLDFGMDEGRQASANFNVKVYREAHKDLQAFYGDDMRGYYQHYCVFGKTENRKTV